MSLKQVDKDKAVSVTLRRGPQYVSFAECLLS